MSKFYPLTVKEIQSTTEDCKIVSFDVPNNIRERFNFIQGQYLILEKEINGEKVRRSYSLCSSPFDQEWKIGVKKIDNGKFSTFVNDVLKVGDTIDVMPPEGNFYTALNATAEKNYVAIAAGSGITPIASIIKTHLEAEPNSTFKLFYINKNVKSIILKEELEGLKNQYMQRFEIFHFLTKQHRDIPLFNGRLSEEKLNTIFKSICTVNNINEYFLCGPEQMILMVRDFLVKEGADKENVHFELFNTAGASKEERQEIEQKFKGKTSDLTIIEGGKNMQITVEQGKEFILDSALNNSADLPYACKGGVCCTCRAKLIEGNVEQLVNYGLEPDEIENGYILTCQAIPTSDKVVVDFDA